jgi:ABC-type multidrug transport system fused ATPase/permease subunit
LIEASPGGLDGMLVSGGREYSGGQQQRMRLVRALMADPEILILVDPTSAVDAHTETRIADGLRDLRRSQTTVVFTTSPALLGKADEVAFVHAGSVVAYGTHASLLADARYRAVVARVESEL